MPRRTRTSKTSKKGKKNTLAAQADRYVLYEQAVQCAESELDFVDETFRSLRNRPARTLREDFCATANVASEWVRRHRDNTAWAVDIDPEVLAWSRSNRWQGLTKHQQGRLHLLNDDVLTVQTPAVDALLAMNFSYWVMYDRPSLARYFQQAHAALVDDGILFLDAYGGYEASREMFEETEHDDFTYVWDQFSYNPINGRGVCKIHFKFKDGSMLKDAFVYEWRLWTLPEITELLSANGFRATVYWEGTGEDGEGDGDFKPTITGTADAGWICYLVAEKRSR